jgi:hypothetical protein
MEISLENNKTKKTVLAILVAMLVIIGALLISIILEFTTLQNVVMSWILTTAYALFAFFLIDPTIKPIQYIEKPVVEEIIQIVEKPIIKEIQIPIENKVIEVVEKPVIKEVVRYIDRPVTKYIERSHKRLNIPKFKFIGSTQTKTFHKRTCKFSKMLKKKFKLHSNSKTFFRRKHFKACKTCMKVNKKK